MARRRDAGTSASTSFSFLLLNRGLFFILFAAIATFIVSCIAICCLHAFKALFAISWLAPLTFEA
jgi:hypothetical protein